MATPARLFTRYRSQGDIIALGQVFDQTAPRLLSLAMSLCAEVADAEDALQATFITAMKKADTFDSSQSLEPWLAGILAGEVRNATRREARRRAEELPELTDGAPGPVERAENEELVRQLREDAQSLPIEQRQVILLQLQHGLHPTEIAEVLELPPGTVRMRIHRGIRALRQMMPASLSLLLGGIFATRGLAAIRQSVLSEASRIPVTTSAIVGLSLVTLPMKKLLLAVGIAILSSMFLIARPWSAGESPIHETEAPHSMARRVEQAGLTEAERSKPARSDRTDRVAAIPAPDRDVLISVKTADGRPAQGVDVMMQTAAEPERRRMLGKTDADGTLRSSYHRQVLFREGQTGLASFTARGVGARSVPVEVDLLSHRLVEVDLRMPLTGTITLQMRTEAGTPYRLNTGTRASYEVSKQISMRGASTGQGRVTADGRMALSHVGLDQFYFLRVHGYHRGPLTGLGPSAQTPHVQVSLVVPDSLVILRGRAVDPSGAPLANSTVGISYGPYSQYQTDDQGVFTVAAESLKPGFVVDVDGLIHGINRPDLSPAERVKGKAPSWLAQIVEGHIAKAGENDLGDAVFSEGELLLSGQLIVPSSLNSTREIRLFVEKLHGNQSRAAKEAWIRGVSCTIRWHADRRFEISGLVPRSGRLRLRFPLGLYQALEPLEFQPGTEGIEICLTEAGSIDATILDRLNAEGKPRIVARLEPDDPSLWSSFADREKGIPNSKLASRQNPRVTTKESLRVSWSGLEPGLYTLFLESEESGEQVAKIVGIHVTQGAVDDTRLLDIDLRDKLRTIEIRIVDHTGAPVVDDGARILIERASGNGWVKRRLRTSKLDLCVVDSVKLRVLASGYRLASRDDVRADEVIRLEPAPELRLRVKWPLPLPKGASPVLRLTPYGLSLPKNSAERDKTRQASRLRMSAFVDCPIAVDGTAIARPAILGAHSISLMIVPGGPRAYRCSTPHRIEFTGRESEEVVLEVNEDSLRQALDKLNMR